MDLVQLLKEKMILIVSVYHLPFPYISLVSSEPILIVIPVIISNIVVVNTIPMVNNTAVNGLHQSHLMDILVVIILISLVELSCH